MRVSEGVPDGRFLELYNLEMFQEHEEVIIFTRDEFNRIYTFMMEQIDYINKLYHSVDEEWKLIGYWPKIMERVHILDINVDLIFEKELIQSYLDAYLYNAIPNSKKEVAVSKRKASTQIQLPI